MGGFHKPYIDGDGDARTRTKATHVGYKSRFAGFEFSTGDGHLFAEDDQGNAIADVSMSYLDANDNPVAAASAVKTVLTWEATYDFQIRGGRLLLLEDFTLSGQPRMWIKALPDIPENLGGSVGWFPHGFPLKSLKLSPQVDIEGYGAIDLFYDQVLHTNKIQVTIKHDAGLVIPMYLFFKIFRP